jgi:hypothetical protein
MSCDNTSNFGIPAQRTAEPQLGAHLMAERGGTANRRLFSKAVFSLITDTTARSRVTRRRT